MQISQSASSLCEQFVVQQKICGVNLRVSLSAAMAKQGHEGSRQISRATIMNIQSASAADRRRAGLRVLLDVKQINPTDLSKELGLISPNALFNFLNGFSNSLSLETVERILTQYPDFHFLDLVGIPRKRSGAHSIGGGEEAAANRLTVSIEAVCGVWRPQLQLPVGEWRSLSLPLRKVNADHPYFGVRVRTPGAELLYPDSTILVCRRLLADELAGVSGARYIVQHRRRSKIEITVRELRLWDGQAWLWPCSTDPNHQQPFRLGAPSDTEAPATVDTDTIALAGIVTASWQPEPALLRD